MAVTYLLRGVDDALWARVKARAEREDRQIKQVLLALLRAYAGGTINIQDATVITQ